MDLHQVLDPTDRSSEATHLHYVVLIVVVVVKAVDVAKRSGLLEKVEASFAVAVAAVAVFVVSQV